MYLSIPNDLMDSPNHLTCQLISHPVFPATLTSPFCYFLHNTAYIQPTLAPRHQQLMAKLQDSLLRAAG